MAWVLDTAAIMRVSSKLPISLASNDDDALVCTGASTEALSVSSAPFIPDPGGARGEVVRDVSAARVGVVVMP